MKEVLLTSSALILALLVLRQVFRKRISRRVQYALWALVLLRLLIPANLPAADFSVLSAAAPVIGETEDQILYLRPMLEDISAPEGTEPLLVTPSQYRFAAIGPSSSDNTRVFTDENQVTHRIAYDRQIDLGTLLRPVWYGGMAAMALWLAASNLRFWRMLRRRRILVARETCRYPVYLVEEGLASPCLFGLIRPAVYLTPAALETREGLRHVLAHEEAHGRHLDPLWSLLRSVCLAVYWFDPLVWLAARAAKEDCELACDEGVLARLGEAERILYGQTLLRLIPLKRSPGDALLTATTMTSDKKRLKDRITRIAENRKMKAAALCAALAVTAAVCAVTFTGCVAAGKPVEPIEPVEPVDTVEPVSPSSTPADTAVPETPFDSSDFGKLVLTIPLTDLTPCGPVAVETISADTLSSGHHGEGHHNDYQDRHRVGGGHHTAGDCATFGWSYDGNIYISSHHTFLSSFPSDYFLCFPEQEYTEEEFTGLFGYDGVRISYYGEVSTSHYATINDYYVFTENSDGSGTDVFLLARIYGEPALIDLDDDGTMELVSDGGWSNGQIVFQRNGQVYEADIRALLEQYWPEMTYMEAYDWDAGGRYLTLWAFVPPAVSSGGRDDYAYVTAWRRLTFDGENLLLYKEELHYADHVDKRIQAPAPVLEAAMTAVRAEYELWTEGYGEGIGGLPPEWDDYCLTYLEYAYPTEAGQVPEGVDVVVYRFGYQVHTSTPERVVLAGGTYVDEDNWVGGFWTEESCYLAFQIMPDGAYKQLECHIPSDEFPEAEAFRRSFEQLLTENGLQ